MLNVTYLLIKFVSTLVLSLLTLTLFDSNPFSLVLLYALITTGINFFISTRVFASDDIRTLLFSLKGSAQWPLPG